MIGPKFKYIPTFLIPPFATTQEIQLDEVQRFRTLYGLPEPGQMCPLEDVVYVLNTGGSQTATGNHFCTIAFMPSRRLIYILGRKITREHQIYPYKNWLDWDGKRIWTRVCDLFGWSEGEIGQITLGSVNWLQNGYDCGPISCQVVQHLMTKGFSQNGNQQWKKPNLPCCHPLRKTMVQTINELVVEGVEKYGRMGAEELKAISGDDAEYNNWIHLVNRLKGNLEVDPASVPKDVVGGIDKAMVACPQCQRLLQEHDRGTFPISTSGPSKPYEVGKKDRERKLLKGARSMVEYTVRNSTDVSEGVESKEGEEGVGGEGEPSSEEAEGEGEGEGEEGEPSFKNVIKGKRKGTGKGLGDFGEVDWTQARIGRFKRPKMGPELPKQTSLRGLNIPFDIRFDEYYNGPTMDTLLTLPPEIMGYDASLVYLANRILINPWSTFKDYGYRLLPNYAQNFNLGDPVMFKEHLCPVGLPNPPHSITDYHQKRYLRDGKLVEPKDQIVFGARELLEEATARDDDTVILTGKFWEGGYDQYIVLDLQRDEIKPQEIVYSCDIDSLIWVTRRPKFYGPFGVYISPMIRNKAPIWKNNHVRVELLFPQSEAEMEGSGPREEWLTKPWSLSNIPHLYFGTVSPGTSAADILLFFPRMTHQDPHRHYWANQVPKYIQNILWDRVIVPAVRSVQEVTEISYFPIDREHWRLKESLGKGKAVKAAMQYPMHGAKMVEVEKEMRRIVSNDLFY